MTQFEFSKYLRRLAVITLALLVVEGGLNWFVDPYSVYGSPAIKNFNALKPEEITHARITKAYAVRRLKPKAIVLGTSAAEWGIDPDHKGWSSQPVFNLALPGGNIYENFRYLQHADNMQPLKQVVLGLDFLSFNTQSLTMSDDAEERLSVANDGKQNSSFESIDDISATLFSMDALTASLSTIRQENDTLRYGKNGMYHYTEQDLVLFNGYRGIFLLQEASYAQESSWRNAFQFQNTESGRSPFTYYRQILRTAYSSGIDLRMFISPVHARLWEILAHFDLLPDVEEWKRTIVSINEEEARNYGKEPFPLWDFTGYNELTIEEVPPPNDTDTIMHWFMNTRHYKKELGDLILDRIFDYHDPGHSVPDDFGTLLDSGNIEGVLSAFRTGRQNYRDSHPQDVAEINALFR